MVETEGVGWVVVVMGGGCRVGVGSGGWGGAYSRPTCIQQQLRVPWGISSALQIWPFQSLETY